MAGPEVSARRNLALGWTLAVLAIALFALLGFWQLARGRAKQAMLTQVQAVLAERSARPLSVAADANRSRDYDWAAGSGGFAARAPLLLDNQLRNGRAGVRVYRMFYPDEGGELLVDLGWLPVAGDRTLPSAATLSGPYMGSRIQMRGLLAPPPSTGLVLGAAMSGSRDGWLMTRIDLDAIERAIGNPALALAPRVLKLDPALPLGYARDLDILPNTLPPERHLGYAVQWFALALAVLVTALVLTLRKPASNRPSR